MNPRITTRALSTLALAAALAAALPAQAQNIAIVNGKPWTKPLRDDVTYFDRHPGPRPEVIDYLLEKEIKWIGADLASIDAGLCPR